MTQPLSLAPEQIVGHLRSRMRVAIIALTILGFTYDALDRQTSVANAGLLVNHIDYDAYGKVLSETN